MAICNSSKVNIEGFLWVRHEMRKNSQRAFKCGRRENDKIKMGRIEVLSQKICTKKTYFNILKKLYYQNSRNLQISKIVPTLKIEFNWKSDFCVLQLKALLALKFCRLFVLCDVNISRSIIFLMLWTLIHHNEIGTYVSNLFITDRELTRGSSKKGRQFLFQNFWKLSIKDSWMGIIKGFYVHLLHKLLIYIWTWTFESNDS